MLPIVSKKNHCQRLSHQCIRSFCNIYSCKVMLYINSTESIEVSYFSQRLSHNVFFTTSFSQLRSHNVFLTTYFLTYSSSRPPIFNIKKYNYLKRHISNICAFHIQMENANPSSDSRVLVRTTPQRPPPINNHGKSRYKHT